MAETQSHRFQWRFTQPAAAIWPLLADTVRFNEAAGLPRYDVAETLQADGTVLFEGRLKRGLLAVAWREIPQNWVAQRWFEHRRAFYNGPLKDLTARLDLAPAEGGGCTADFTLTTHPANLAWRLLLATGFLERTAQTFGRSEEHTSELQSLMRI